MSSVQPSCAHTAAAATVVAVPSTPRRSRLARRLVTLAALALAAGALVCAPARADEELEQRRVALESVLLQKGAIGVRGKAVHALADLKTPGAARVFTAALDSLAERVVDLEKQSSRAREAYEPYEGFSFKDPTAWDTKKRLREQMDELDEHLRDDLVVLQMFSAATTKFTDGEAVAVLRKSAAGANTPHARRALYSGLLLNALVAASEVGAKGMKDSDPTVRLTVLEALAERKEPQTEAIAIKALGEKGWPHRQAAAKLLGEIGTVASIGPLVKAMAVEDGRVTENMAAALRALTGEEIGPFPDAWKAWYDANKKELAAQGARAVRVKKPKESAPPLDYYGIKTKSRRIVFLLDISGSMKEVIGNPDVEITGDEEETFAGRKIDIAAKVLKQAVRNLDENTWFNIITFNHEVKVLFEKSVQATQDNKNRMYLELNDLEPKGATFTYGALDKTFQMAGRGVTDKHYDPGVDTVFVLSDGAPTDDDIDNAQPMDYKKILAQVKVWNSLKRVQIHTIAIDPKFGVGGFLKFMKGLASRNDGTYREIGADGKLSSPLDKRKR